MSEATALILKQGGIFGALLIIAGFVIWKLWLKSTEQADKSAAALATSNAERLTDHREMTAQLLKLSNDAVAGLTNGSNAIEASTTVMAANTQATRDVTEELRRRRGG